VGHTKKVVQWLYELFTPFPALLGYSKTAHYEL
jgi:hypothetical protein